LDVFGKAVGFLRAIALWSIIARVAVFCNAGYFDSAYSKVAMIARRSAIPSPFSLEVRTISG
jgi:hypothetical protein